MLSVEGTQVERILIVDDDAEAREIYADLVEEAGLQPILADGRYGELDELLDFAKTQRVHAALCDYHLAVGNYATFNGAQAASRWYDQALPALLCTNFEKAQVDEMRSWRRYIPVLVRPNDLEPANLKPSLAVCIREMSGDFTVPRRPFRSLLYVVDRDARAMYVQIPSWSEPTLVVDLLKDAIPPKIWSAAKPGARMHAWVNIGANRSEELYFEKWEPS